jgi:Flp pilus assembly pilin Flp
MHRLSAEEGQTSVEYALLLVICILAVILFMAGADGPLVAFFGHVAEAIIGVIG